MATVKEFCFGLLSEDMKDVEGDSRGVEGRSLKVYALMVVDDGIRSTLGPPPLTHSSCTLFQHTTTLNSNHSRLSSLHRLSTENHLPPSPITFSVACWR
ncbi:hypothetical protein L1987_54967 [Smallanthus sonchifolius]|uniref:Uncharacterized protein n=1 Tax=Smallanthus sonchifolius TaxID=185202 RepID=A0ACB9E9M8_9ASTR|nr:hypothetical protein L1987_54967 [Smallanthus sonchifolius]